MTFRMTLRMTFRMTFKTVDLKVIFKDDCLILYKFLTKKSHKVANFDPRMFQFIVKILADFF